MGPATRSSGRSYGWSSGSSGLFAACSSARSSKPSPSVSASVGWCRGRPPRRRPARHRRCPDRWDRCRARSPGRSSGHHRRVVGRQRGGRRRRDRGRRGDEVVRGEERHGVGVGLITLPCRRRPRDDLDLGGRTRRLPAASAMTRSIVCGPTAQSARPCPCVVVHGLMSSAIGVPSTRHTTTSISPSSGSSTSAVRSITSPCSIGAVGAPAITTSGARSGTLNGSLTADEARPPAWATTCTRTARLRGAGPTPGS